jgi:hypothetical protein
MQILVRDRPITVLTDRVKLAYMLNETGDGTTTTTFNPGRSTTRRAATGPHPAVARTTRSEPCGRHIRFPARFNN